MWEEVDESEGDEDTSRESFPEGRRNIDEESRGLQNYREEDD